MNNKKVVAVALSGGVDSGAAAYILKEKGYEVFGITMKLFNDYDVSTAQYAAEKLGIKHYIVDYSEYFKEEIINKFIEKYLSGKTPNPCIMCNMKVKYGMLLNDAKKLGADFLASGHYADVKYDENDGEYHLFKGKADYKDQSYYLYHLNQHQLSSLIFPLSDYTNKEDVRLLVQHIIPETSKQKDSLNICFVENMSHNQFIRSSIGMTDKKGNFVDKNGKFLGRHKGIYNYTIGQKRRLGVKSEQPLFVVSINAHTNEIILGDDEDTYKDEIIVSDVSFIHDCYKSLHSFDCEVKLCQWGYYIKCNVYNNENNTAIVKFDKRERAPAPGQAAVFYKGHEVLGGGIIL